MTTTVKTELQDALRSWARGSLPLMAAVDFLIATDSVRPGSPFIWEIDGIVMLDLFDITDEIWRERTGYMSGGEIATWRIARSLADGELNNTFWRLDERRKQDLLHALTTFSR